MKNVNYANWSPQDLFNHSENIAQYGMLRKAASESRSQNFHSAADMHNLEAADYRSAIADAGTEYKNTKSFTRSSPQTALNRIQSDLS